MSNYNIISDRIFLVPVKSFFKTHGNIPQKLDSTSSQSLYQKNTDLKQSCGSVDKKFQKV